MEDRRIIELYFARDEQAITETDGKYGKLCFHIARNILNDAEDAKECVNDIYLGVWNAIPPTSPNNFMSFVCRIVRNLSLKKLEFLAREKRSHINPILIHHYHLNYYISSGTISIISDMSQFSAVQIRTSTSVVIFSFLPNLAIREGLRFAFSRKSFFSYLYQSITSRVFYN